VSSVNIFAVHVTGRLLIKMTNRIGPSTLSCGMPLRSPTHVDNLLFTTTRCLLPEKKFSFQVRRSPFMLYASSFLINFL